MNGSASSGRRIELAHHRGLDGLRGLAVAAVLLYHGGVSWAQGGFLGVEVFFVLSGFLITSLLLAEWSRTQTVALRAFWARRARRLLPALFVLVAVIGVYYALAGPAKAIPGFLGDGLSTLLYYSTTATGIKSPPAPTTSPPAGRCRRSSTPGRWRSRSSSTSCGRSCCSRCWRSRDGAGRSRATVPCGRCSP
jgi:hypothetical protein